MGSRGTALDRCRSGRSGRLLSRMRDGLIWTLPIGRSFGSRSAAITTGLAPSTAITSSIAGPQRAAVGAAPGWPGWLATGILSRICSTTRRDILLNPRCLPGAGRHDGRKSGRLLSTP